MLRFIQRSPPKKGSLEIGKRPEICSKFQVLLSVTKVTWQKSDTCEGKNPHYRYMLNNIQCIEKSSKRIAVNIQFIQINGLLENIRYIFIFVFSCHPVSWLLWREQVAASHWQHGSLPHTSTHKTEFVLCLIHVKCIIPLTDSSIITRPLSFKALTVCLCKNGWTV